MAKGKRTIEFFSVAELVEAPVIPSTDFLRSIHGKGERTRL